MKKTLLTLITLASMGQAFGMAEQPSNRVFKTDTDRYLIGQTIDSTNCTEMNDYLKSKEDLNFHNAALESESKEPEKEVFQGA
ncbi:MAG: hypothetical protein H6622_02245 [Halobacteriovoraceae bacterium]|nr:hypothetical protein [Halobacteriovoraceae bacterium]